MIPVEYRSADWRERPFLDQAHRVAKPEPLWRAFLVYLIGIPLIAVIVLIVFGGPG